MADKTSGVNAGRDDLTDSDLPAADPFAELTRIMGFDPRKADGATKAAAQETTVEDFKIDLEQELMREFGDDEPAEEPVAAAPEPEVEAAPEPEFDEPLPTIEAQADEAAVEPVPVADEVAFETSAPAQEAPAIASAEEAAEDLMAAELTPGEAVDEDIPVLKLSPPVAEPEEEAVEEEMVAAALDDADEAELEAEFNALLGNSEQHEILDTSAEKLASVAQAPEPEAEAAPQPVAIADAEDDLSVEFGFPEPVEALDRLPETEAAGPVVEDDSAEPPPPEAEQAEEIIAAAAEEDQPVAEVEAQEPAAVEEDDPFAMLAAMAQKYRVSEPSDSWRSTTQFSRATPHVSRSEPHISHSEPLTARSEPAVAELQPQPVWVEPQAPVIETPPARIEKPHAFIHPAPTRPAPAPEIETVDVPDRVVAIADDLDIPELETAEETPVIASPDDLDTEFNNLLQQMSAPAPAAPPVRTASSFGGIASQPSPAAARPQPAYGSHRPYEEQGYGAGHQQPAAAQSVHAPSPQPAAHQPEAAPESAYRQAAAQPTAPAYDERSAASYDRPSSAHGHEDPDDIRIDLTEEDLAEAFDDFDASAMDDFDLDGDFEDDGAPAPYQQPAYRQPKRRRGLLVAAIIGGVAILGVAGAVAISMMGDAQGSAPEMVKADQAPFKIRPENPGGAVLPSQESKVYETVARTGNGNSTVQENLLSNAEEPVDLPDQLPENADDDLAMSDDQDVKSEDRILPTTPEEAQAADGDALAVAPRKVRTMVVKPDGTLAPREEIEPQAQTNTAAPQSGAAAAQTPAADDVANAIGADDGAQPAGEQQAGQPENVAHEQTASIEPQPVVEGGWTMQIASESSEEAAKATYQKMLGRYGNVLDGKGVNIIKADIAGKGTFWRIRIPAESRDAAAGMCNSLKSAGGKCFVTKS